MLSQTEPNGVLQAWQSRSLLLTSHDHMPHCNIIQGILKPIYYDRVKEVTQGPNENLAFLSILVKAVRKMPT